MGQRELFTNNAESTLDGSITSSQTTFDLTNGSTFPSGGFRIIVEDEIMYVLTRSGNSLLVVRGAENTTGASHADLTAVRHVLTAGALDGFRLNYLHDIGFVPIAPSLSTDDDEFDDESFDASWLVAQGSPNVTITEHTHAANIKIPGRGSAGQQYAFLKAKSPSAGDWVQCGCRIAGNGSQFPIPGPMMANGSTYGAGKQVIFEWSPHENALFLRGFDNFNAATGATGRGGIPMGHYFITCLHMRLMWNSSNNYSCYISHNGVDWIDSIINQSCGSVGTVTHMGFAASSWGAAYQCINTFTYCRFSF